MEDLIPISKDINEKPDDVFVRQHDHKSRYVRIALTDKDLENAPIALGGCYARMFVQTNDTTGALVNGEIADAANGIVSFLLPNSVTKTAGKFKCEVRITDPETEALISTRIFHLIVEESIFNDDAYEGAEELSALQQALNENDGYDRRINDLAAEVSGFLDENAFVKPIFIGQISGAAAQGMAHLHDDKYLLSFVDLENESNTVIGMCDVDEGIVDTNNVRPYGHGNSIATDGIYYYVPAASGRAVHVFGASNDELDPNRIYLTEHDDIDFPSSRVVDNVFDCGGVVYGFGEVNGRTCYWPITRSGQTVFLTLPVGAPRVNQTIAADGKYLYWLRSNPNAIAVFDFQSGTFIRWVNIDSGNIFIGEAEQICFVDGRMKLLSQYYYPNSASDRKRFYMISDLCLSRDLPARSQHVYINEPRKIYVSNAVDNGVPYITNNGDDVAPENQTGSENHPFPSLEMALYAALTTPNNPAEIFMVSTGTDYHIDDLVLRVSSADITINCAGNVVFEFLHVGAGNLTVKGKCFFSRLASSPRSRLQIDGGTFTASGRISGAAPYSIGGAVAITGAKYTGGSDEIVMEFQSGASGVVGFAEGQPRSNSTQQLNLTLYNVRNAGQRDHWTTVYDGDSVITLGGVIDVSLPDFYVLDNTVYRVRWQAETDGGFHTTVVNVSGNTVADLATVVGAGASAVYRVAKIRFRPRVYDAADQIWRYGDIRVISVADFSGSGLTSSGELPEGFVIDAIEVRGY